MKKTLLSTLALLTLVLFFSSCQKELSLDTAAVIPNDSVVVVKQKPDTSFLVKTLIERRNGDSTVYNYSYDEQGRVISAISATGVNKRYTYSAQSYTVDDYSGSKVTMHELYLLNNLSLIDSAVYFGATDTTSEKYVYNSSKQLVKVTKYLVKNGQSTVAAITTAEYDSNGNLVKDIENANLTIYYAYTNLPYTLKLGLIYQAKYRTNFVNTYTYTGSINQTLNASYTFDNFNRLSNEIITNAANGSVITNRTYLY